jgi:hypothetical protein
MMNKDSYLLEEAYLSISQPKKPVVPSDEEVVTTDPNEVVSAGPMDEPAPGVDVNMVEPQQEPSVAAAVEVSPEMPVSAEDSRMSEGDEDEEDAMAIDNLNSIRESIMKIAGFCGTGGHLEPWQQQKLAIAMDNLAGVARSLGSSCHG